MKPIKKALTPISVRNAAWMPSYADEVDYVVRRAVPALGQEAECPVTDECSFCEGTGRAGGEPCYACDGKGEIGCDTSMNYAGLIVHLNDDHEWTFAQLADWLDAAPVDFGVKRPDTPYSLNDD